MTTPSLMIASAEPQARQALGSYLGCQGGCQVLYQSTALGALAHLGGGAVDVLLVDHDVPALGGLELLRQLREDPSTEDLAVVLLAASTDPMFLAAAWAAGADAVMAPEPSIEIRNRVEARAAAARRRQAERAARRQLEASLDGLIDLLAEVGDHARPGFVSRGTEVARIAAALAAEFGVPEPLREDMTLAARLHPIGYVALGESTDVEASPQRWATAAAGELRRIPRLEWAATLLAAVAEHWDGSGHPEALQRGQIPLRSRILRVAIDLVDRSDRAAALGQDPSVSAALEHLRPHAGTWYDPAVVNGVEAALADATHLEPGVVRVPPERLAVGMILAEDLVTAMGVKLLTRGAVLTGSSLELIQRRHQTDPIAHAVRVRRP